jgi:transposase
LWTEDFKLRNNTFSKSQIQELEKNPNVISVRDHTITYHPNFKVKAVHENLRGKSPAQIFEEHGFNLDIVGKDIPRKRLYKWRQVYNEFGDLGLSIDKRGKTKTQRTSSKELSIEEKLKKAEARIKFLEVENDFLKKLEELERQALEKKKHY